MTQNFSVVLRTGSLSDFLPKGSKNPIIHSKKKTSQWPSRRGLVSEYVVVSSESGLEPVPWCWGHQRTTDPKNSNQRLGGNFLGRPLGGLSYLTG